MTDKQNETNDLLRQFLEAMQTGIPAQNPVNSTVNLHDFTVVKREHPVFKPSPKLERAVAWLNENPARFKDSSRSLEAEIGVSHTLITQAKKVILEASQNE